MPPGTGRTCFTRAANHHLSGSARGSRRASLARRALHAFRTRGTGHRHAWRSGISRGSLRTGRAGWACGTGGCRCAPGAGSRSAQRNSPRIATTSPR